MKKIVFCLSLLMFVISVVRAAETDELVRIRQNYVRSLLPSGGEQEDLVRYLQQITPESEMSDQVVMELHQLYPFDLKKIQRYLSSLKADGTWPDINMMIRNVRDGNPRCMPSAYWNLPNFTVRTRRNIKVRQKYQK